MGSNCCKNVRVAGIPQKEPANVNNSQNQCKNVIPPVPLQIPKVVNMEKLNSESQESNCLPEPITVDPEEPEHVPIPFRLPTSLNETNQERDKISVRPSQFPPILRQKVNSVNESQQQTQQQSNANSDRVLTSKTTNLIHPNKNYEHDRLPPLHKPSDVDKGNVVESVSENSQSDNDEKLDSDWRLMTIPERADFYRDERFYTSTPIPPNSEYSDSDGEHTETLNHLLRPISINNGINDQENLNNPITILQILRLREQLSLEEYFKPASVPDFKPSPEQVYTITDKTRLPMIKIMDSGNDDSHDESFYDQTIYLSSASIAANDKAQNDIKLDIINPDAFDESFNMKRQHVIENSSYRLIIEAWRPNSIEELVEHIRNITRNKPTIDRLWIIFYWIVRNIEYDTVPYVGKKHGDKSAEAVFRTGKAISDGYANLFKRLCDDLDIVCERVHGYSKPYVFDSSNKSSVPVDHAWNAVQINQYWYLVDLTRSAGYLENNQVFKRELNSYYFLPRPNEMIYHHFPAEERWQLLKHPIKMAQYMQMPKLWPKFFQLDLHLIKPCDIIHVDLIPNESHATVLIQAPRNVSVVASFTLNDKEVDGGHRILFDSRKRVYRCYFAPSSIGLHIIRIFAKNDSVGNGSYNNVAELELEIKQLPSKIISFPKTWKVFSELNLEIVGPCNTHVIKMDHGDTHTEIIIRAPSDVEISGRLTTDNNVKIPGGHCTYLDRRKGVWRCLFAPHCDGTFEAFILAKRRLDPGSFHIAVKFKIKARRIPVPPLSYPKTWQLFHDLDLQIENPRNSATVIWPEYGSYVQICIKTPDDVCLMSCIERNGMRIENGSLTQFNNEKQYWQLYFAPERTGEHKLLVFAHCSTPDGTISGVAVEFNLNVTQLRHSIKFPVIYTTFITKKCRIYEPLDGVLKQGAIVRIHCEIPNARQVDLTIDSKWIKSEGYRDSILKRQIIVGTREVIIYAKYEENTIYNELVKYTVQ